MSLKVIGAGFGRTGTRSLKEALEMLGFAPCHHMMEVFTHPEQVPFWDRVALGEKFDWEELFAAYQSSCDWPSCTFYKELAAYYPTAKIILSLRDPKSWFKSVSNTIMPAMKKAGAGGPGPLLPGVFGPILIGPARPAHILTPSVTARGILNMTAVAVVEAQERASRQQPTLFG